MITKPIVIFLVLIVIFTGIIATSNSSSPVVSISDGQVDAIGSTTGINITLSEVQNGLSGYNLTISLSNTSIAEIISVSFPEWAALHDNSTLPGDSVWIKAADLNDQIKSGTTNISLATLTIRGDSPGDTSIIAMVTKMDDDIGNLINPSTDPGNFDPN
jgi:hypothetical protein